MEERNYFRKNVSKYINQYFSYKFIRNIAMTLGQLLEVFLNYNLFWK